MNSEKFFAVARGFILTPTVDSNYSITGTTKSFCLKRDEFFLLLINLPRGHCWKHCSTGFILKHSNGEAREIVAVQLTRTSKLRRVLGMFRKFQDVFHDIFVFENGI